MPMESKAQARLMFMAARGKTRTGVPRKVAEKFVQEQHGKPIRGLPERVGKKRSESRRVSGRR